jgi:hypothetical protein
MEFVLFLFYRMAQISIKWLVKCKLDISLLFKEFTKNVPNDTLRNFSICMLILTVVTNHVLKATKRKIPMLMKQPRGVKSKK